MNQKYYSRIIDILMRSERPLTVSEIAKALKIKSNNPKYETVRNTIGRMSSDGVIKKVAKRRYVLSNVFADSGSDRIIEGRIRIEFNRGVINDKANKRKVIVKRKHLNTALDGDIVEVLLLAEKSGKRPHGEVQRILKRAERTIVGTVEQDGYFWFLVPDDEKYYVDFLIPEKKLKDAHAGDKVKAKFIRWTHPTKSPEVEVISVLGKTGEIKAEFDGILHEFFLPERFNKAVEKEVKDVRVKITPSLLEQRLDLRKTEIITIDPTDAKDFDDALSLEILDNGNYWLGVHIADVSHYVLPGSKTDAEAFNRGNSTYLVDRVVPMLPEKLSNDICSLKPNRVRLAFSVFLEITRSGRVVKYKIHETIIKSSKRFTYDEVLKIIKTEKGVKKDLILSLNKLAQTLRQKRLKEGGINFETSEVRFKFDDSGIPVEAYEKTTTLATQLVEECMLAANRAIAENLYKMTRRYHADKELPFIFRVHEKPDKDKLSDVLEFIMRLGHKGDARSGTAKAINNLLKQFENRPEKPLVHSMIIRAMPRAIYSEKNIGHYGLGFKNYTHFTSPIRRYADLIVHRLTKEYAKNKPNNHLIAQLKELVKATAEQTSLTERNSMEAERASAKVAASILASKHIGEDFTGTISGVTSYGLFVRLDDIYAEGLLHIRDLHDDYYMFDEKNFRLVGRRKKFIFGFGDRIKVRIIKVSIEKRNVDLKLAE